MDSLSQLLPFHLFDAEGELRITDRRLPHWSQAGAICFITWRTMDSMPKTVLEQWCADRMKWLRSHGIDPNSMLWREQLQRLDQKLAQEFLNRFWNRWQDELDANLGECVLRQAPLAQIVGNSLHFFDGDRYSLLDFIVMPTHVHILASFPDEEGMLAQCESWKHYTAAAD